MYKVLVVLIILLGAFFRFVNLTPHKIYPDSYVNLIIAQSISSYHSVVGFLGSNGMLYPDFFMWSRPGFPLAILGAGMFIKDLSQAGVMVSFIASVLTIPLTFLLSKEIFKDTRWAILTTLFATLSFNHIVWSGFLQTEALSVFLMTNFLVLFFRTYQNQSKLADVKEILTGSTLALAVLTRYEYILLLIPSALLIIFGSPQIRIKLLNYSVGFLFTFSLIFTQLFPVLDSIRLLSTQLQSLLQIAGGLLLLSVIGVVLHQNLGGQLQLKQKAQRGISVVILLFCLVLGLYMILPQNLPFLANYLGAYKDFFEADFLIGVGLFLFGLFFYSSKTHPAPLFFCVLSIVLLAPIYWKTNPQMQRYLVHLLPFFVLLATFGYGRLWEVILKQKLRFIKPLSTVALMLPVLIQAFISFQGIKNWDDGVWFRTSYDEKSAQIFTERIASTEKDFQSSLVLASFPEPYFIQTQTSTYSLADAPPYFFINSNLDEKTVYLIQDMGMLDIFPKFNKFIDDYLSEYLIDEYTVGEVYHYADYAREEQIPVRVYSMKLRDLKYKITNTTQE